jgi:hypothetical protein
MAHARTLLLSGRVEEGLAILERLQVLPYEGATEGRALWREAHLRLAIASLSAGDLEEAERHLAGAREWPEHLGAGKPYTADVDERLEDWLTGLVRTRAGDSQAARTAWQRVLDSSAPRTRTDLVVEAMAAGRLGDAAGSASRLAAPLVTADPAFAAWARELVNGGRPAAVPGADDQARVLTAWAATAR